MKATAFREVINIKPKVSVSRLASLTRNLLGLQIYQAPPWPSTWGLFPEAYTRAHQDLQLSNYTKPEISWKNVNGCFWKIKTATVD